MILLAIDTSTSTGGVALRDEERLIGSLSVSVDLTHSEGLMPALDALLQRCGVALQDIGAVGCSVGPGSFTGLRVGIATAQGIAAARDLPCVAVPTLDLLAWQAPHAGAQLCPLIAARKGWIYTRLFAWDNGEPQPQSDELYIETDELFPLIQEKTIIYGPAAPIYCDMLREVLGDDFLEAPDTLNTPNPAVLAERAFKEIQDGGAVSADALLPHYLAASQAEVTWKQRRSATKS
ncbi:MAG: tRNA (adenosine(37)-N6)-threonylcarbamoyltransferase complex dimerization subunit type 1 TsaB [Candidatus Hinthialibacter antarcticus]|nr:tRNA (adenosine(37)-N6)-threonylcarbamoyltransferase complex dimerization subunit type 1 TsaB [Candidatus Hinthialibacter antarcticus]